MIATATLSDDGATFTLAKGSWSRVFPVADLPDQIAFYRGLCEVPAAKGRPAQPRKCAWAYLGTLQALLDLAARIKGAGVAA